MPANGQRRWLCRAALAPLVLVAPFFWSSAAIASDTSIGAVVEEPPTTAPRPTTTTTAPNVPTAPSGAPTTVSTPSLPVTPPAAPAPVGTTPFTGRPSQDAGAPNAEGNSNARSDDLGGDRPANSELRFPSPQQVVDEGVVESVKSVASATKRAVKDVIAGKPVADVVADALPEPVADVVVPAVRTASTFAFPIGLAAAVFAFLAIQQRIDAADPKLSAAPLAHDDDVVVFE